MWYQVFRFWELFALVEKPHFVTCLGDFSTSIALIIFNSYYTNCVWKYYNSSGGGCVRYICINNSSWTKSSNFHTINSLLRPWFVINDVGLVYRTTMWTMWCILCHSISQVCNSNNFSKKWKNVVNYHKDHVHEEACNHQSYKFLR